MPIDDAAVRHVARLARLDLPPDELRLLRDQLSAILDHIAQLRELDLQGVEPLAHVGDFPNPARPDEPGPCLGADRALDQAPEKRDGFFVVPPVLE